MSMQTVYLSTSAEAIQGFTPETKLRVTTARPFQFDVLIEANPVSEALTEISDGIFEVSWGEIVKRPHVMSTS